jgi:hypothetical protein
LLLLLPPPPLLLLLLLLLLLPPPPPSPLLLLLLLLLQARQLQKRHLFTDKHVSLTSRAAGSVALVLCGGIGCRRPTQSFSLWLLSRYAYPMLSACTFAHVICNAPARLDRSALPVPRRDFRACCLLPKINKTLCLMKHCFDNPACSAKLKD